jgi:DNA-directed RNA polymerase subunit omega
MMNPPIEDLLERTGSKFRLVTVASMRARQINAYFGQLGDGLGSTVPPQVTSLARKPLSIAFEELDAGKIIGVDRIVGDDLFDPMGDVADGTEPLTDAEPGADSRN